MQDDRCCGSGTCIINQEGLCWCGQQWDGEKMCAPCMTNHLESKHNQHQEQPQSKKE